MTAGRAILREQGRDKLSLRAVAARVGVSQAAPYSHFADKKALLRAICASGFRELADTLEACRSSDQDPSSQILDFGTAYVDFALNNPEIYRLMISTLDPVPKRAESSRDQLIEEATRPYALLNQAFRELVPDTKRADTLTIGAWSMVHGLASLIGEGLVDLPPGGHREVLRALTGSPSTEQLK